MSVLKLSIQIGDYESVRALRDGTVRPEGIELDFQTIEGDAKALQMQVARGGYDVSEFNAGVYMSNRERGTGMTGLPVYLHRRFRHGFIFVNAAAGIRRPEDLRGRRVGGTNFGPAGCIWVRGILEDDFGVAPEEYTWVADRDEDGDFAFKEGLKVERIRPDQNLDEMLKTGELDAMISPLITTGIIERDPRVARLFPDYKQREIAYYRRAGIFPIMHVTMIREEIVREHPWVVASLLDAFEAAKRSACERLANPRVVPLAWYMTAWEEERELLGDDPWEYGLGERNRHNLDTMARYVHRQGLTSRRMTMRDLFPAEAFDWRPKPWVRKLPSI